MFEECYRIRNKCRQNPQLSYKMNMLKKIGLLASRPASNASYTCFKEKNIAKLQKGDNYKKRKTRQQQKDPQLRSYDIQKNSFQFDAFIRREVLKTSRNKIMKIALIRQQDQYRKKFLSGNLKPQEQNKVIIQLPQQKACQNNTIQKAKRASFSRQNKSENALTSNYKLISSGISKMLGQKQNYRQIEGDQKQHLIQKSLRNYRKCHLKRNYQVPNRCESVLGHSNNKQVGYIRAFTTNKYTNKEDISRWQDSSMEFPDVLSFIQRR